jgi:hypothetical protein
MSTSINMTSLMKNIMNHEMFDGTPKIMVPSNGVVN